MGLALPPELSVAALKRRVGKELSGDDDLLEEYLAGAIAQAQAPAPFGCGRVLRPDPPLDEGGSDTAPPVTRTVMVRGRHVPIPDARELAKVDLDGEEIHPAAMPRDEGYRVLARDGKMVQLTLHRRHVWWWFRRLDVIPRSDVEREHTLTLTGRFGFVMIPPDLCEAIYLLAARAFYEQQSGFADTVKVGEGAVAQVYYRQLPPRTQLAFQAYTVNPALQGLS